MKNTNQVISARIMAAISQGMPVDAAINSVMGAGTYEKLAADVYEKLTAAGLQVHTKSLTNSPRTMAGLAAKAA